MPTTTAPMTATTSTQTQTTGFTATAIPVAVHKFAMGQFPGLPTLQSDLSPKPSSFGRHTQGPSQTGYSLAQYRVNFREPV